MYHQLRVRVLHRRADIEKQSDARAYIESVRVAPVGDRLAVDEFQCEPGSPIRCQASIDEPRQVRVRQAREDASFAHETGMHVVEIESAPDQLDCHVLGEVSVVALASIDHAHATAADPLNHPERTQQRTDQGIVGAIVVSSVGSRPDATCGDAG